MNPACSNGYCSSSSSEEMTPRHNAAEELRAQLMDCAVLLPRHLLLPAASVRAIRGGDRNEKDTTTTTTNVNRSGGRGDDDKGTDINTSGGDGGGDSLAYYARYALDCVRSITPVSDAGAAIISCALTAVATATGDSDTSDHVDDEEERLELKRQAARLHGMTDRTVVADLFILPLSRGRSSMNQHADGSSSGKNSGDASSAEVCHHLLVSFNFQRGFRVQGRRVASSVPATVGPWVSFPEVVDDHGGGEDDNGTVPGGPLGEMEPIEGSTDGYYESLMALLVHGV